MVVHYMYHILRSAYIHSYNILTGVTPLQLVTWQRLETVGVLNTFSC